MNVISNETNVKIICLQETWLSNDCNVATYKLPSYGIVSRGKTCCQHGGLIIYIHNSLRYEVMPECEHICLIGNVKT